MATQKVVTLDGLGYFKEKTDELYAKKTELPKVATSEVAGVMKPGKDFDIASDGTITLYSKMTINSFTCAPSSVERGSTVNEVTLNWSLNKVPTKLTLDTEDQDVSATKKVISDANLKANKTYTLKATDARDVAASRTAGVSFLDKRHWGVGESFTESQITDEFVNGLSGELASSRTKTFTVNAAEAQHIYYCFPASWGTPRFFVGGFEGGFSLLKTFDHVNASGASVSYVVYKSTNAGLGNTTVEVK